MPTYDLQDPTDLDIMRGTFDGYTGNDWEVYIEQATKYNMGYKNINALTTAQKKSGLSKFLSPKMLQWVLNLVEEIDAKNDTEEPLK
ncbi:hypothetical protein BH09BAC1_BH09BAC1_14480 [soil metagenome]